MPKTEELKERINYLKGFLTILLGVVVLLSGGLVNLYLSDVTNEVFWLGVGIVVFILLVPCPINSIKNTIHRLDDFVG